MKTKPKILVVGSFVMDLIVRTGRYPGKGETVLGLDFSTASGGKGANQAVQAARLGAAVEIIGKVGNDDFGRQMIESVRDAGVDVRGILVTEETSSSIGNVQLLVTPEETANRIIVVPGANACLRSEDVAFLRDAIADYDMVMLQLEIPMEINELVASYAHAKGVPVMLNPAPAAPLSAQLLSCLTYISPNEHEAAELSGVAIADEESAERAARALLDKGIRNVIITLGERGALYCNRHETFYCDCVHCDNVQDPTAAGDSFVGAFCTAICEGMPPRQAMAFANATASLTVARMGAQPSLPARAEVDRVWRRCAANEPQKQEA